MSEAELDAAFDRMVRIVELAIEHAAKEHGIAPQKISRDCKRVLARVLELGKDLDEKKIFRLCSQVAEACKAKLN